MDTAWIQIFVLTLVECVAPAGKTVCQEREFDLQFLTPSDCEYALEQLVSLRAESESVIVDVSKSRCAPAARQRDVFASLEAINEAFAATEGWHELDAEESQPGFKQAPHQERLASLPTCEDSDGVAPCKIGEIIIEEASQQSMEVWRRD